MKRVAIILGSPYPQSSKYHLRGVNEDVQNFKKFLVSSCGGAWQNHEVHSGIHIKKETVSKIQGLCSNADMALVVYSGHGFMKNGENYIQINPREAIKVSSLTTKAKRQLTIIDACRTDYTYEHLEGIGDIGLYFDNTRPTLGRQLYDYNLKRAPLGTYTMFSSKKNQASQDTENGGLFTYALLNGANEWATTSDKLLLPAHAAFRNAQDELIISLSVQSPQFTYSNRVATILPFCVSPQAYIRRFETPQVRRKSVYSY